MSNNDNTQLNEDNGPIIEIGKILKSKRLEDGKSLADIARILSIRKQYIQAIEQGKTSSLPGNTYTYGFIRSYATYLKLNPNILLKKIENNDPKKTVESPSLTMNLPPPEIRLPSTLIILTSMLSVVIAYTIWMYYVSYGSINYKIPYISELQESNNSESIMVSETSTNAEENNTNSEEVFIEQPAPLIEPELSTREYGETGGRIVIHATMETWIQIQNESRAAIETIILHAGDKYYLSGEDINYLMTSNIGGLDIFVDGLPIPPMGTVGELKRDIRLNPNSLLNLR